MKFVDIVGTAIGNTFRSKLRTTLTVVAIFIGAFTLTITSAIGTGISSYINTQVASIGSTDVLSVTKTPDAPTGTDDGPTKYDPAQTTAGGGFGGAAAALSIKPLTKADLAAIRDTTGIRTVNPMVRVTPTYIEYGSEGKYQLTLNAAAALTKADLAAGRQLSDKADDILLPDSYLKNMGLGSAESAIGKTVTIGIDDYLGTAHTVTATIAGVQNKTLIGGGVGLSQSLTDELNTIQSTGRPANLGESYLTATAHFDPHASQASIDSIKKDLKAEGFTAQTVADQIGSFQTVISGIIGVLNAFAVIALVAAGFGIINTLLMSVQERTREIGLMKAMGMSGGKVYALFSMEAVFIGFLGSAIGAGVAIGVGSVISDVLARTALSGLPGLQVMQFAPTSIVTIILVVMAIAFLAGTLPARRAARQNPIDALRYE